MIIQVAIGLYTCSSVGPVDIGSIRIIRVHQHPFLGDHDRALIIVDKNGTIVNKVELYPDSGSGCAAYLFDSDNHYILIDCNGQWFTVDKQTGTLNKNEWQWRKKMPDIRLGRFVLDKDSVYAFSSGRNFQESDVYTYKDPNE